MVHFFLANTHSNLFLSLAIIVQEGLKNCHIVYLKKSNQDKEFLYFFRNQMHNMNVTVSFPCEKPLRSKKEQADDRVYGRRIKSAIKKLKKRKEESAYYFFDDRTVESQYISKKIVKKSDKSYLVQDETHFFVPSTRAKISPVKHFFRKLKYGFFLKDLVSVGELRKYDGLYSLKPESMLEKYKSLTRVNHIQARALFNIQLRNIAASLFKQKFDEFFDLNERNTLVFLPRIETLEQVVGLKVEILHKFTQHKYPRRVFIKNHSNSPVFLKSTDIGHDLQFIPNGLPDECFFVFNNEVELNYFVPPTPALMLLQMQKGRAKITTFNNHGAQPNISALL